VVTYGVVVQFGNGSLLKSALTTTARWGDLTGPAIEGAQGPPPDGEVDFLNLTGCVDRFQGVSGAPPLEWADLHPGVPNGLVDFNDIGSVVDAFRGFAYPFPLPDPCPSPRAAEDGLPG